MKKLILLFILIVSSFISASLSASDFSVRGEYNKETQSMTPYFQYSWDWNEYLSSSVYAGYSKEVVLSVIEGYPESKDAVEIKQQYAKINYLTYDIPVAGFTGHFGLSGEVNSIKKNEFGYLQLPPAFGSTLVTFKNDISIIAYLPLIMAGFKYVNSYIYSDFRFDYYPVYLLNVKQETVFNPIIAQKGISETNDTKSMGYKLDLDLKFNTSNVLFADLLLNVKSDFIRIRYGIKQLNYDTGTWSFADGKIDTSELTTTVIGGIAISNEIFGTSIPVLGIGRKFTKIKDNITGKSESVNEMIFSFGFDSKVDFTETTEKKNI